MIIILAFYSCKKREKISEDSPIVEMTKILNWELEDEIKRYIEESNYPDSSTIYTLEFFNEDILFFTERDTSVIISFLRCKNEYEGYKGIMNINNNSLAVFDKQHFGYGFYNPDSLLNVSFDSLKCLNVEIQDVLVYEIKNGNLKERHR